MLTCMPTDWRNNSASEGKWAKLFNLSRSVTSNEPVLFRRPARYTRAYSRPKLLTVTTAMLGPSLPRGHMSLQKGRPSYDHQLQYRAWNFGRRSLAQPGACFRCLRPGRHVAGPRI